MLSLPQTHVSPRITLNSGLPASTSKCWITDVHHSQVNVFPKHHVHISLILFLFYVYESFVYCVYICTIYMHYMCAWCP